MCPVPVCSYTATLESILDFATFLQPGGAGVPFYIGNAQCSACKGLGFEPCSVCMGYQAELPPPDPCNGPASRDSSDSLVTTSRWLQSFPDSRKLGRARRQVTLKPFLRRLIYRHICLWNMSGLLLPCKAFRLRTSNSLAYFF